MYKTYTHRLIHSKAATVSSQLVYMDMRYQSALQHNVLQNSAQHMNSKVHIMLIKASAAACNRLTCACRGAGPAAT